MSRSPNENAALLAGRRGAETKDKNTRTDCIADRPFAIVIIGSKRREWGRYQTRHEADGVASKLRAHGFDAIIEGPR